MITLSFWRSGGCDHAVKAMTLQTILHIGRCIFRKGECLRVALMMIVTRESVRRVIVCGLPTSTIYHLPAVGWADGPQLSF